MNGEGIGDFNFHRALNADSNLHSITLPQLENGHQWYRIIDTSLESGEDFLDGGKEIRIDPSDHYLANPRTTIVLIGK